MSEPGLQSKWFSNLTFKNLSVLSLIHWSGHMSCGLGMLGLKVFFGLYKAGFPRLYGAHGISYCVPPIFTWNQVLWPCGQLCRGWRCMEGGGGVALPLGDCSLPVWRWDSEPHSVGSSPLLPGGLLPWITVLLLLNPSTSTIHHTLEIASLEGRVNISKVSSFITEGMPSTRIPLQLCGWLSRVTVAKRWMILNSTWKG